MSDAPLPIAVVMGGFSEEYEVSLQSAQVVCAHLSSQRYHAYPVLITPERWEVWLGEERFAIQREDFSFEQEGNKIQFQAVFNAIHGSPGEDGVLSGYLDLLGIPQTGSDVLGSALTFSKGECNILLSSKGIATPPSVFLPYPQDIDVEALLEEVGLPCFVKPSRSGSSIGVTKVKEKTQLLAAIAAARKLDSKVLVEGMISGRETACGVSDHSGQVQALAVTDIVPQNEFFDYESKYSGLSEEVTPARISDRDYAYILRTSEEVYRLLGLQGLVRVDYIVDPQRGPVLIEVNTVPGLSQESLLPKQASYAGLSLTELFDQSLAQALKNG